MDTVDFIFFDVDDTLLDHRQAERKALADVRSQYLEIFGHLSVDALQETYHAINTPLWRAYADGEVDKSTVKQQRFARLLDALDAGHANAKLIGRYYMQQYAEHWAFIPGARDAFRDAAERYDVGVLTNGFAEVQARKFERFPEIKDRAQAVVVSEETGAMKPDPHVFQVAAERAGTDPERILYVGDSYRSDVLGGQNAGWRVAWYVRPHTTNGTSDDRSTDTRGFAFTDWDDFRARVLAP